MMKKELKLMMFYKNLKKGDKIEKKNKKRKN